MADRTGSEPPAASSGAHDDNAEAAGPPDEDTRSESDRARADSAPSLRALTLRPPSKATGDGSGAGSPDAPATAGEQVLSFFPETKADGQQASEDRMPSDSAPSLKALTIPPADRQETPEPFEFGELGLGLDPDKLPSIDPPPLPKEPRSSSFHLWVGAAVLMLVSAAGGYWLAASQGWIRIAGQQASAEQLETAPAEAVAPSAETAAAGSVDSENDPVAMAGLERQQTATGAPELQAETGQATDAPQTAGPSQAAGTANGQQKDFGTQEAGRKLGQQPSPSGTKAPTGGKSDWEAVSNTALKTDSPAAPGTAAPADTPAASGTAAPASAPASGSPELVDKALAEALSKVPAAENAANEQSAAASAAGETAQPSEASALPSLAPVKETLERKDVAAGMDKIRADVAACAGDRHGIAKVQLTIANTGRVTKALVQGVFSGTAEGSCIARAVRRASFPRFKGDKVEVSYPFTL